MAKKCDFCAKQGFNGQCQANSITGVLYEGSSYCEEAAQAYKEYMIAQVTGRNTKNINVNHR